MTTKDAIKVARIMAHHNVHPARQIAVLLNAFNVDLVDFFNEADDFMSTTLHDEIFARLQQLKFAEVRTRFPR